MFISLCRRRGVVVDRTNGLLGWGRRNQNQNKKKISFFAFLGKIPLHWLARISVRKRPAKRKRYGVIKLNFSLNSPWLLK